MPKAREGAKLKFTPLFVTRKRLSAGVYWDTEQKGLALRVEPSDHRSFVCVYSHHSKPRWYTIGSARGIDLAQARKQTRQIMNRVAEGGDPAAEKRAQRMAGTFAELHQRYVEFAKTKNRSWRQAESLVKGHVLPVLGRLRPGEVQRRDVRQLIEGIAAPVLANQVLASASAVFSWAVKQEVIVANPCRGIERAKTKPRERVLAENEVSDFWAAFNRRGVAGAALKFVLLSAQRPGEVSCMRREHVKDGVWWEMPGAPDPKLGWPGVKNGEDHKVWLSEPARAILAELTPNGETTGFVFAGRRRGKPIGDLDVAMRDICKELAVSNAARPHDLRRTAATIVQSLGLSLDVLDKVMNHKDPKRIRRHYNQYQYEKEAQHMMEALAARVLALAEGKQERSKVHVLTRKRK
jgi:integrase